MFSFAARIILLLLIIGGAIAIIGNYIGRSIGRRRLTLFNLRPRHTATAVTVLSGMLIVFTTLGIILAVSQDARTALFGLEDLRRERAEKRAELADMVAEREKTGRELAAANKEMELAQASQRKAKREIASLEKTRDKLDREVEVSRQSKVLFAVGETLLTSLIQAGPEKTKLEAGLQQILSAADAYVRSFGVETEKHLIFIPPEEFDRAIGTLYARRGGQIVLVTVTRNTLFGEEVPVRFDIMENSLVYKAGDEIAQAQIDPALPVPQLEQEIKKLLSLTHLAAKKKGVLPDAGGSLGSVPYSDIFALAKRIKAGQKGTVLKTRARANTYVIGPLEVDFIISNQ